MSEKTDSNAAKRSTTTPGFDLRLSDDYMVLLLSCTLPPRNPELVVARVRSEMVDLGFEDERHIQDAVTRLEKAMPHGPQLEDVVLLEGLPPTAPVDESITWGGNFHAKGFTIDPATGRADYRRKIADVSVTKDQLLAEIIPGSEGENGHDVFGRIVPPRAPRPARIREGKNVRFEAGSSQFFATESGRIRYVAGTLSVDDIFHIKGDAGLRTGNIDHPGALVVGRDIQTDSEVRATGDIDVGENIEDAVVESGGNITVAGGISCKEKCSIRVAGNLHARFIRNAHIDAGGDIYVDSEINQCVIRTRGAVIVTNGRIVGGNIIALRGVETGSLGSEACIPGEVTVAKDYTMEGTVVKKRAELESARELVMKLRQSVAPLRAKRDSLPPRLQAQLLQLNEELKKREAVFKKVEKELNTIFQATRQAAVPHVYVHGTVFPDNLIQIGAQVKKIKDRVQGPLRMSLKKGKFGVFKLKDNESLSDKL